MLHERAHAKVNLGLAVLARRGDGFHEVETSMARLELADELRLSPAPGASDEAVGLSVRFEGAGVVRELTAGPDNLVHRAATAFRQAYREARGADLPPLRFELLKRVPIAAGLGGGSSDAAAALRLLRRAFPTEAAAGTDGPGGQTAEPIDLEAIARRLGSDVPFFLQDVPAALARGRGERLTQAEPLQLELVLVNPGFAISAAEAYGALIGFTPRLRAERARERLLAGEEPGWSNALQPGVLRLHPQLREALGALRAAGLRGVLMSGSGPTCFGVAESAERAAEVARELAAAHPGWWTSATRTG